MQGCQISRELNLQPQSRPFLDTVLTCSLTRSRTHWPTSSLSELHSLTHELTYSLAHGLTRSLTPLHAVVFLPWPSCRMLIGAAAIRIRGVQAGFAEFARSRRHVDVVATRTTPTPAPRYLLEAIGIL